MVCRPVPVNATLIAKKTGVNGDERWADESANYVFNKGSPRSLSRWSRESAAMCLIQVEHERRGLMFERLFDLAAALGVDITEIVSDT